MLQFLVSLFNNADSRVRVGVLQGGVISLKLFTNFLTHISQYLDVGCSAKIGETQTSYLLYTDDLVLPLLLAYRGNLLNFGSTVVDGI